MFKEFIDFLLKEFRRLKYFCVGLFLYATTFVVNWKYTLTPIRLVLLKLEYQLRMECKPLRTIIELLNFEQSPPRWNTLVEPLVVRCEPRLFDENFETIPSVSLVSESGSSSGNIIDLLEYQKTIRTIGETKSRPEVLVCHDLAGNYRDDRFINGSRKWDDYRYYHWAGIDYFCYFSHNFVTIPTLSWINAAHRNGVKVLGTLIVESTGGRKCLEEILATDKSMVCVAEALVFIAKHCKFEGWLINVECDLSRDQIPMLYDFVNYLTLRNRKEIPNGKIFWYDSIIANGLLRWQNELNYLNEMFFDVSDGILINYGWNDVNLERTVKLATEKSRMKDVFIGIDVFGRGQLAKFQTNTTLARIKKYNLSVGIFAPGWTFEATGEYGVDISMANGNEYCNRKFIERNDEFWKLLWKYFHTSGPIVLPFYTTFCIGSGKYKFNYGQLTSNSSWLNLSTQQWQPSVPATNCSRYFDDAYHGGSCLKINGRNGVITRLFTTNFSCSKGIVFAYVYKKEFEADDGTDDQVNVRFLLNVQNDTGAICEIVCIDEQDDVKDNNVNVKFILPLRDDDLRNVFLMLSQRNEKVLPSKTVINNWQVRYHYIDFHEEVRGNIVDIGIQVTNSRRMNVTKSILLGALNIHEGIGKSETDGMFYHINQITNQDFITH